MNGFKDYNFNLGIPKLLPEWKKLFSSKFFLNDLSAGVTVAFVAIPLSLAIALASGVSPGAGLITAIIAGIVCAFFGGAPLAVSGPAAAMAVLIADTVEKFGVQGLVFICLLAGLMQLASGIFGFGRLGRYVPLPVIAGFTAGIGVIIIIGQLPRAFGLIPPPESHTFDVFLHIRDYFDEIVWDCLLLVLITFGIIKLLPRFFPKLPAILIGVAVATLLTYFFNFPDVPLIGTIPNSLPMPQIPKIPANLTINELFLGAFSIYILASLETLLSCSAIDKLTGEKKHDSNQELIGQGLGNIAVSLFGGIPVTSVIARSATNVKAGAKTRRSSIIHSLIILLAVYVISRVIGSIPIAALAAVLFSIAFSMINYREFYNLALTSRSEASIYLITFLTIIFFDLIAGVQVGMVAAGLIVLFKAAKTHLHISTTSEDGITRLTITGSLTFLSTNEITELEKHLEQVSTDQTVILDLSSLTNLDSSGASAIIDLFNYCQEKGIPFYIIGLPRRFELLFKICGGETILEKYYLISESELRKKQAIPGVRSSRGRLVHGINRFYSERKQSDRRLYDYIAAQQDPHTLFVACSDSRIVPSLITSTDPGELFTIRNVGNYIPAYDGAAPCSEAAALEFALTYLDITDIVICGHANCGAMRACQNGDTELLPPKLKTWIQLIKTQLHFLNRDNTNDIAKINVLNQIENLKQYPIVQEKLKTQAISLHAWFFDFEENLVHEWNAATKKFEPILSSVTQ